MPSDVLNSRMGSGPHGLGDPNDKTLRKVEREVLVPKIMRDRARIEKCVAEVRDFEVCAKSNNVLMVAKCRDENEVLKNCLTNWYKNEQFIGECTEEYLRQRTVYRETGLTKKQRAYNESKKVAAEKITLAP